MNNDESSSDQTSDRNEVPIQIDLYGIKTRAVPRPPAETEPESWLDVWKRVQKSLMRIACEPLALIADVFTAARSVVRGIGAMPPAISQRIAGAHRKVKHLEGEAERTLITGETVNAQDAFDELQGILMHLRAQGISAGLERLPDGRIALVMIRPEHEEIAGTMLAEVLPDETVQELTGGEIMIHKRLEANDPKL